MPLASIELRWFLEDAAVRPSSLRRWFRGQEVGRARPLAPMVDRRPDLYLLAGCARDVGIKWREGRLEIKGRREGLGTRSFDGGHEGSVERWLKWSLGQGRGPRRMRVLEDLAATKPYWFRVEKSRLLRKIEARTNGLLMEVPAKRRDVSQGVSVELTRVRCRMGVWWSIAFEGFPDGAIRPETLDRVAGAFLISLDGVRLEARHSLSYPEWIQERLSHAPKGIVTNTVGRFDF